MGNNISKKNKDISKSKKQKKSKKEKKEKKEKKDKKERKSKKQTTDLNEPEIPSTSSNLNDLNNNTNDPNEFNESNNQTQNEVNENPEDFDPETYHEEYYNPTNKKVTQEDFELLKVVGRGSFGKVMMVKKKDTNKVYAMKILKKEFVFQRKQVDHTKAEKAVLMKLNHPFIVKLHFAFQTADKLYMILDFVNGGELFYHLKNDGHFTENRAKFYAAQIATVLLHIHSLGIIYRDLKPENILLDHLGNIVITDFGLSKQLADGEQTSTFCGTPDYLAPEVLEGEGHGAPVDWWSLGILIYEMIVGMPPFYDDNLSVMYDNIRHKQPQFPRNMSFECKSIIMGLLEKDQNERLGGEDVLKSEWFADIDFEKLKRKEYQPPWVPPVKNKLETSQIDTEFTREDAVDTPPLEGEENPDAHFEGFTFVQTNIMDAQN